MKNELVARILHEIADLLDLEGVAFKPRAYRRAAEVVEALAQPAIEFVTSSAHGAVRSEWPAVTSVTRESAERSL